MGSRRHVAVAVAAALAAIVALPPAHAAAPAAITDAADAAAVAAPLLPQVDLVSVFQPAELGATVRDLALAAAAAAGAPAVVGRGFTSPLTKVMRGTTVVQQASAPGYAFPMATTALPVEAVQSVMGREVGGHVAAGRVVMGQTTAGIRGAQAGDTIQLRRAGGGTATLTIGMVAPDALVGGTELLMSIDTATFVGGTIDTRVLIYGHFDRAAVDTQLRNRGLHARTDVRIRRSWDPADPDSTLSMAVTKSLLGEFDLDYANVSTFGWTSINATWRATYLPAQRETFPTGIKAMCHSAMKADLAAALQEVVDAGLASAIDVANTNAYGGCATGSARLSRITQALGSVSRHSWGQPIDMNTVTNCQGCVPQMDCRVVRIFRKHNFAWGGNFLTPDGMHFEWVGTPRHTMPYPSKYCPNQAPAPTEAVRPPPISSRGTFFAEDGFLAE